MFGHGNGGGGGGRGGHDSRTVRGDSNAVRSGSVASSRDRRASNPSAGRAALEAASTNPSDLRMTGR